MSAQSALSSHLGQQCWQAQRFRICCAFQSAHRSKPAELRNQRRLRLCGLAGRSRRNVTAAAEPAADTKEDKRGAAAEADVGGNFIPVLKPEDLPKGVRKEVKVQGISVLLFWYRNELYAIEARSPAEGAYSEGFVTAKFTQDFGIECPSTKSVFSLKTGEIVTWYPNNFVLRLLTPQDTCRPLDIYPVKLTQDAIYVDVGAAASSRAYQTTRGGADSSIERNNVYALQPKSYIQGQDPSDPFSDPDMTRDRPNEDPFARVATITVAIVGVGGAAVAGTAFALYKENLIGLVIWWIILFGASALFVVQYQNGLKREQREKERR
ncbi:hypothetical protein ABBQ38_010166 [Trebouxia sp. C0009 RCD-2024]